MEITVTYEHLYKAACEQRDRIANSEAQAMAVIQVLRERVLALEKQLAAVPAEATHP